PLRSIAAFLLLPHPQTALINTGASCKGGCHEVESAPPSREGTLSDLQPESWLRLRTVVVVRWTAALGQTAAVLVAVRALGVSLEYGFASLAIATAIITNIALTFLYPATRRLSNRGTTLMLGFDVVQLGALLAVTGGLDNPFALLILAPVTIA